MKFLTLLILLVSQVALAQFETRQDVSLNLNSYGELRGDEVKKILLHEAATQAIEKFASDLGFSFNDYQTKLSKNFQEYYDQKLKALADDGKAPTGQTAQEIYKNRQLEFIQYSKHADLLKSYSIISMSRNPDDQGQWSSTIQMNMDQVRLQRLLRRTLQADATKFSKMWLIVESNIHSFKWSDIGLEREGQFSSALATAWKDWWVKNLPTNFDEVEVCHDECLNYLHNWQSASRNKAFNPDYSDGVWVNVSYDIFNIGNSTPQYPVYKWEARVVFTDINTKKVLGSLTHDNQSRSLRGGDLQRLNSILASQVFSSSSQKFPQMKGFLEQVVKLNQVGQLKVKGHKHLGDVLALKDLIKTRGSSLGLEIELDHFSQDSATLLYFFQGEEKAFQDLLNRINELKSSKVYELKTQYEGSGPVIELHAL